VIHLLNQKIELPDNLQESHSPVYTAREVYQEPLVYFIDDSKAIQSQIYVIREGSINDPRQRAMASAFNEYFGGGMSSVVFQEISYRNGKIKKHSVYYVDGTLKKEVDFEDSLLFMKDKEVGTGKKYTRDGILKYEWHITNMDENRFKRSYNIKGKLVEEKLFDNMGNLIEVKTPNS